MSLLDRAFEAVRALPETTQEDLARFLLDLAANPPPSLNADELQAIAEAEAELARGERVPPAKLDDFWRKNGV